MRFPFVLFGKNATHILTLRYSRAHRTLYI
nr:MAG TPA: hypothetical protein [Caudoviricetes sp.]